MFACKMAINKICKIYYRTFHSSLPFAKSARYGINSVLFRGSLLWNNLPSSDKTSETLKKFKFRLKIRGKIHCTCNVCH